MQKSPKTYLKKCTVVALSVLSYLFCYPQEFIHQLLSNDASHNGNNSWSLQLVYAEVVASSKDVLSKVFKGATEFVPAEHYLDDNLLGDIRQKSGVEIHPLEDAHYLFYIAKQNGNVLGYAAEHTVYGKWGPIKYLLSIDPNGSIKDVSVLEYQERRGRPISKRRFTKQFKGKNLSNPLKWQKDIRGVTGASISSKGITDGIRKTLHVFEHFYG